MRNLACRVSAIVGTTVALTVGLAAAPDTASAAHPPMFVAEDSVLTPGSRWLPIVRETTGWASGQVVFAVSGEPLNGPPRAAAGPPKGVTHVSDQCTALAGNTALFACPVDSGHMVVPGYTVAKDAADLTTAYFGYAYVPAGGDLSAGIATAQSAASLPASDIYGTGRMTVLTAAHAALNTVAFDLPDLAAGGSVRHHLHVHAIDPGELDIALTPAAGQPEWRNADVRISDPVSSAGAVCWPNGNDMVDTTVKLICQVSPGEQTVDYTLTAAAGTENWRMAVETRYDVYRHAFINPGDPDRAVAARAEFSLSGVPLYPDHRLLARTEGGQLYAYEGTGKAAAPFYSRYLLGNGWQTYNALTKLAPVRRDPGWYSGAYTVPEGQGDLVGRDTSGTLWYYRRQVGAGPYAPRTAIGAGWNAYSVLTGGGDLDGDGSSDLLARDRQGTLWFYAGTGKRAAPFAPRIRIGGGWSAYTQFAGSADLTGDGIPDLTARDSAGVLWLYAGTGNGAAPFAARARVGGGWNAYTQTSLVGDLNRDGRTDLVGRDSAGVLWLYAGTGKSAAPFGARTRIGAGWNTYQQLL